MGPRTQALKIVLTRSSSGWNVFSPGPADGTPNGIIAVLCKPISKMYSETPGITTDLPGGRDVEASSHSRLYLGCHRTVVLAHNQSSSSIRWMGRDANLKRRAEAFLRERSPNDILQHPSRILREHWEGLTPKISIDLGNSHNNRRTCAKAGNLVMKVFTTAWSS